VGLLSPWFLAGILGLGLPLYLHLLRRHVRIPRPFSSLMFFERRTQSSIQHRRLRYLLLLCLRLALLVLLVLAFADPYINRPAAQQESGKLLLLVLDNSFSMHAGSRMADARAQALSVLASRPGGEPAQIMTLGSELASLTQPIRDQGALRAAVQGIQAGDTRSNLGEFARAIRAMAASLRTPIELHFFSDMQRSGMPASFAEMAMPGNVSLVLHPVAKAAQPNWTVESVNAPGRVWETKTAGVSAVIAGYGTPAATRTASLVVNGKTVASRSVQVPAGGSATVDFPGLDVPFGFSRCAIKIDSADTLPADDQSLFTVERSDPVDILLVHEANDSRSPVYVATALAAAAGDAFHVHSVTVEQAANLDASKYPLVVLSGALALPSSFENSVLKAVRAGGSVLVAAGTSPARNARIPVLGLAILGDNDYTRSGDGYLMVGDADTAHPAISQAGRWAGVKFFYAVRVDPLDRQGNQQGDIRVVARLSDGTPLLLDETIGEGKAMLLTSGLDNLTNDFPLHPIFVPFVEQTARYLSGAGRRSGSALVDSLLELRNSREQGVGVEIVDPSGHLPLSLKEEESVQSYRLPSAGFYQLKLANGRQDVIGVNADPRESDLAIMPQETLALWRGSANAAAPQGDSKNSGKAGAPPSQEPYGLWWYVLLLALAAAGAESWFSSRYLGTRAEEP
jgi:hypothetical protein